MSKIKYFELPTDEALRPLQETTPTQFPFDIYVAYEIRLTAFINGAIYCLNHEELEESDKQNRFLDIKTLYEEKIRQLKKFKHHMGNAPVKFGTELYNFYQNELPQASGFQPKDLALGEAFYTWQELPRRHEVVTSYQRPSGLEIIQKDTIRHADLTSRQKSELIRIHSENPPKWFKDLPAFAQNALEDIVPQTETGDWSHYQKFRPSTLRHIPGEANTTLHELIIKKNGVTISHSKKLRQGVPTSFNMKDATERQESANENLRQMLCDTSLEAAKNEFNYFWGLTSNVQPTSSLANANNVAVPMPLLFGGLVTPKDQAQMLGKILDITGASGDENNTKLAREKENAIQQSEPEYRNRNIRVFNLNVGINILSKPVKPDQEFIEYVKAFYQAMNQRLTVKTEEQQWLLNLIHDASEKLETLENKSVKGRNRNLYLASLYDFTIRSMKALSTGNCKSSKDRFGVEISDADAMHIYAAEYNQLPDFDATGNERENFTDILAEAIASGHQFMIAHCNSPGSPGIKDEGILDHDVIPKLEQKKNKNGMGIYTLSCQAAEFNKPGTFWQKFGPRIQKYASWFAMAVAAATCIGLIATGVFSPIGILGLTGMAAMLGSAAPVLGAISTVGLFAQGASLLVSAACFIRNRIEAKRHSRHTFENQMKRNPSGAGSTAAIAAQIPMTNKMPPDSPSPLPSPTHNADHSNGRSHVKLPDSLTQPLLTPASHSSTPIPTH